MSRRFLLSRERERERPGITEIPSPSSSSSFFPSSFLLPCSLSPSNSSHSSPLVPSSIRSSADSDGRSSFDAADPACSLEREVTGPRKHRPERHIIVHTLLIIECLSSSLPFSSTFVAQGAHTHTSLSSPHVSNLFYPFSSCFFLAVIHVSLSLVSHGSREILFSQPVIPGFDKHVSFLSQLCSPSKKE